MNKSHLALLALLGSLALTATAQDTNALKTSIGVFETQTGTILIKGFEPIGSLSIGADVISARCKETIDLSTGKKIYGLTIGLETSGLSRERVLLDYDELDPLLHAIDYLNKIDYDVTLLSGFDASFTTKAGLQVSAHSIRRQGNVQASIQYGEQPRIFLTSVQMKEFYALIEKAKKNLDAYRDAK